MTGGMADLLAAHQPHDGVSRWINNAWRRVCTCRPTNTDDPIAWTPAHQAEVLSSAGFVDGRALLDDLRGLADQWDAYADRQEPLLAQASDALRAVRARYALPDPTPKEQQ